MDEHKFVALNEHGATVAHGRSMAVLKAMLAGLDPADGNTYTVYTSTGTTLRLESTVSVTEVK
jgi:hypothetical protein